MGDGLTKHIRSCTSRRTYHSPRLKKYIYISGAQEPEERKEGEGGAKGLSHTANRMTLAILSQHSTGHTDTVTTTVAGRNDYKPMMRNNNEDE